MTQEIERAILTLLAADTTLSPDERERWRALVEGRQVESTFKDYEDALTNAQAARFLGLSRTSFWRLKQDRPSDPLLQPFEPKPGVVRYSKDRLARYRQATIVKTASTEMKGAA